VGWSLERAAPNTIQLCQRLLTAYGPQLLGGSPFRDADNSLSGGQRKAAFAPDALRCGSAVPHGAARCLASSESVLRRDAV